MASLYDYCKQNNKEYILQEWDYELNGDITPDMIAPQTHKNIGGDVKRVTLI